MHVIIDYNEVIFAMGLQLRKKPHRTSGRSRLQLEHRRPNTQIQLAANKIHLCMLWTWYHIQMTRYNSITLFQAQLVAVQYSHTMLWFCWVKGFDDHCTMTMYGKSVCLYQRHCRQYSSPTTSEENVLCIERVTGDKIKLHVMCSWYNAQKPTTEYTTFLGRCAEIVRMSRQKKLNNNRQCLWGTSEQRHADQICILKMLVPSLLYHWIELKIKPTTTITGKRTAGE